MKGLTTSLRGYHHFSVSTVMCSTFGPLAAPTHLQSQGYFNFPHLPISLFYAFLAPSTLWPLTPQLAFAVFFLPQLTKQALAWPFMRLLLRAQGFLLQVAHGGFLAKPGKMVSSRPAVALQRARHTLSTAGARRR